MTWSVSLAAALDEPWTSLTPTRVGTVPQNEPTPDLFALVARDEIPERRLDIYRAGGEAYVRDEALIWHDWIALGVGERAYVLPLHTSQVITIPLPGYFQEFHSTPEFLLILSGSGITRIDPDGTIAWQASSLALDGTSVERIANGIIYGKGEWDPPGGWRPFAVRLRDGQLLAAAV